MEDAKHLYSLGRSADAGNRHHRYRVDTHAILATSDGKSKPPDYPVQSPALALPLACYQEKEDHLLASDCHIVYSVSDRRPVPVVRRGYLELGIVFAATMLPTLVAQNEIK
jgi:hypothetical protein